MDEQSLFLEEIADRLERGGIPYMLTGSVALALYAEPRMTRDIDVVIDIGAEDARQVVKLFEADCYIDAEEAYEEAKRRGMFNAIHKESLVKVDFIIRKDSPYRKAEFQRRRRIDIGGSEVVVVTPEDLLLSKLVWAREGESPLQIRDAEAIARSLKDIDWEYIFNWSDTLGVRELAERLRSK